MSSERRPARITLALPDGALRRRLADALAESGLEVELAEEGGDVAESVRRAAGDVVIVGRRQVGTDAVDVLGDLARDADEAGIAVIGEVDPGTRARLLAAGFASVLSKDQDGEELAASLEALAEAGGGSGRPEVGGARATPRLADFLEEGLVAFGLSCADFDENRI